MALLTNIIYTLLFIPLYLFAFIAEKFLYPRDEWYIWGVKTAWKQYWKPLDD